MLVRLFLFALIGVGAAYKCNSTVLTSSTNYPSTWSVGQPAEQYSAGQDCNITIRIPDGLYLSMLYVLNTTGADQIGIIDQANYFDSLPNSASGNTVGYCGPEVTIRFKTANAGSFSFQFHFSSAQVPYPVTHFIYPGDPGTFYNDRFMHVFKADTQASIVPFQQFDDSDILTRMLTVVYDGNGTSGTYLGSFKTYSQQKKNFVSTKRYLTVVQLNGNPAPFFAQDNADAVGIKYHYGLLPFLTGSRFYTHLNATDGPQATYTVQDGGEYLKFMVLDDITSSIKVYNGGQTNSSFNLLATYTGNNTANQLPQQFGGLVRTYVLNKSTATMKIYRDTILSENYHAFVGRKGIVMSRNYPLLDFNQNISTNFYGGLKDTSTFQFNWKLRGISPGTNVRIGTVGGSSSQVQADGVGQMGSPLGYMMTVDYSATPYLSQGFLLEYEIVAPVAGSGSTIVALFVSLLVLLFNV